MEKVALKPWLKGTLLGLTGAGAVSGAGAGGFLYGKKKGIQSGAEMMADKLGKAFLAANAKENARLRSSWEAKNKIENAQIANHFLRKGYSMGQAETTKAAGILDLEGIYNAAFEDELEKIAVSVPGMKGLGEFAKKIPGAASAFAKKTSDVLVNTAKAGKEKSIKGLGAAAEGAGTYAKYLGKQWPALATGGAAGVAAGTVAGMQMSKQSSDGLIEAAIEAELEKLGFSMAGAKALGGKALGYLKNVGKEFQLLGRAATSKSPIYKGGFGSKGMGRRLKVMKSHAKELKVPLAVAGGATVGAGAGYAGGKASN